MLAPARLLARPCLHVAVASCVPDGHRLVLESLVPRFDEQALIATTFEVLAAWRPEGGES